LLPRWDGCGSRGVCRCVVEVGRLSLVPGDGIEPVPGIDRLELADSTMGKRDRRDRRADMASQIQDNFGTTASQ
jgi:hypothetical protein